MSTDTHTGLEVLREPQQTSPVFKFQCESPPHPTPPPSPGPTLPQTSCGGVSGGGPPSTRTTAERNGSTSGPAGESQVTLQSFDGKENRHCTRKKPLIAPSLPTGGASVSPAQPNPLNYSHCADEDGRQTLFFPINLLTRCQLRAAVEMAQECRGPPRAEGVFPSSETSSRCQESTVSRRARGGGGDVFKPEISVRH